MNRFESPHFCEAPVYAPSHEEFDDPIKYIQKIYSDAVNQSLSDLSISNREKSAFVESFANYWRLQNAVVFTQYIRGKQLDIYKLYKVVKDSGGYDNVCHENAWVGICRKLGFEPYPEVASAICAKYRKFILPIDNFHNSNTDLCKKSNNPSQMLVCDVCCCEGVYHTFCLDNPISHIPKRWLCPKCFANEFNKKNEVDANGSRKSDTSYTLRDFSYVADEFKTNYFKKPLTTIALAEIRDEFWRLVNDGECNVTVEYGADLCSSKGSSGFPTTPSNLGKFDYCSSPWNLNNLAKNPLSALHYLPSNMTGMKAPSFYIGMVFSCFCWHTEDHWSFSINYLHTGDPKTWYGVPGARADAFEAAMQVEAGELFIHSPDVLHHVTCLVPPDRLLHRGVPVYHLDQLAGEFVVTFPRAYHAGYSNGFNFAEAVNFCPAEWFPFGLHCVDHYALLHRPPLFSHAELLCRLAESGLESSRVPITFLLVVTDQLAGLLAKERSLRRHLVRLGVRRTERFVFEALDKEARKCQLCRTTLFTSALTCSCSKSFLCLEHYQSCTCCAAEDQILLYRYGLDELSQFVERPQARIREYQEWKACVDDFLRSNTSFRNAKEKGGKFALYLNSAQAESHGKINEQRGTGNPEGGSPMQKIPLQDLVKLRDTGHQNCYPDDLVAALNKIVETAESCASMIGALCAQKPEGRKRRSQASSTSQKHDFLSAVLGDNKEDVVELDLPWNPSITKITMNEFEQYVEKVNGLPCTMPRMEELNRFKQRLEEWHTSACELLSLAEQPIVGDHSGRPPPRLPEIHRIEQLVTFARGVDVELCHLKDLKHLLECVSWLESVERVMKLKTASNRDVPSLKELIDLDTRGQTLAYVLHPDRLTGQSFETEKSVITTLESALLKGSVRLQKVICEAQVVENSIKEVLKAPNGSCELSEAEALVAQASCLKATFDESEELAQLCAKAHTLLGHFACFQRLFKSPCVNTSMESRGGRDVKGKQELQAEGEIGAEDAFPEEFVRRLKLYTADSTPQVWLKFYEEVCSAAKKLPFVFPDTIRLRNLLIALDRCYSRIKAAFLPSDNEHAFSPAILLEVLLPRPKSAYGLLIQRDAEVMPSSSAGDASGSGHDPRPFDSRAYADACKENVSKFLRELNDGSDFDHMYDTVYTPMIENELQLLHYLRRSNMRKSKERDQDAVIYCVCRQPGYTGIMLQCELCKDWFHKRCVGFSSRNVDIRRVRYTCPRCERSLRPELSVVIAILEELVPHVTGTAVKQDLGAKSVPSDHLPTVKSSITSDLMAPLVSVPFLLRLPALAAVQMLCERAFAFVRRVRTVILSTPELRKAFVEYEAFSGVQMQWNNFNEGVMLHASARQQQRSIADHQSEQELRPVGLTYSHLPPNVVRPPGMQPLVLRTTALRSLASERLHHLHRQHHFSNPSPPPLLFPHHLQRSTSPSRQEPSSPAFEMDDTDDRDSMRSNTEKDHRNSNKRNEKEAAVALAIMSSATTDLTEPLASPREQHSPFPNPHSLPRHPRRRTLSGEGHQRHLQCEGSMSSAEFHCYIPPDACSWLDTLIGEACALEVSLPQIRWLWQLSLAADPDSPGALHPRVVYEDEMALRRREYRRRSIGEDFGVHRRARPCRSDSSERPFYFTFLRPVLIRRLFLQLAHKGRESALGSDGVESYGGRCVKRRKVSSESSRTASLLSQRRRNKPAPRSSMGYLSYLASRRRSLFRFSRDSKRQSETYSREGKEEAEVNVKECENENRGGDSDLNAMADDSVKNKEIPHREPRGGVRRQPSNSSFASISSVPSSPPTGGQHSASSSKFQFNRGKQVSEVAQNSIDHHLAATRRFATAGAVRRTSILSSTRRDRGGGGRMMKGLSRQQRRTLVPRRRSREENKVGGVNEEDKWQEFCEAPNGCKRPRGTVAWVACDQCNYWYHQRCVGIMSTREVPEVYVCGACQFGDVGEKIGSRRPRSSRPKSSRISGQPWSAPKVERQREGSTGSSTSSGSAVRTEAQDSSEDPPVQLKRSGLASPEKNFGNCFARINH
ncbi:Lysine-specific demethylase 5B [Echinococcus granulosus]|uniref:[histone H3]-trimethyl-L-lysine(4) demethylase n=1 Tax=Echinococcus granulosus TaxID=6210 RepID=W6ULY4_ECHGR|nr:Lysine-specific demethylase 5B [Echinococcus granulosus]EUB62146.1 Lysine-specific demethylase 5B [Echinococcus granulosus]